MIYSFAGKCPLPCPKGDHHESSINVSAALVLFDAIPTCWVSKHNSVGLIWLQCRSSDAVAAQRRCIPKCVVKMSAGIITASMFRRCNCAAPKHPKMLPRCEKLVWRIIFLHFILCIFYCQIFASIGLQKKHYLWLVGHKNISTATIVIFNANRHCNTENQHNYMAAEKYY